MLNKSKTDPELGRRVEQYLIERGVNTPMVQRPISDIGPRAAHEAKLATISKHFAAIMSELDLDLEDDSLAETPSRVAKMFVDEIFWGLDPENFPKFMTITNKMDANEMIIESNIRAMSACEHHFVTIDGLCHVAYVPNKLVPGLSKINRVVEYFCRRPQVQERITAQIYHALAFLLETPNVAVVMEGVHYCIKSRGVEDQNSFTATHYLGGTFKNHEMRTELFSRLPLAGRQIR